AVVTRRVSKASIGALPPEDASIAALTKFPSLRCTQPLRLPQGRGQNSGEVIRLRLPVKTIGSARARFGNAFGQEAGERRKDALRPGICVQGGRPGKLQKLKCIVLVTEIMSAALLMRADHNIGQLPGGKLGIH